MEECVTVYDKQRAGLLKLARELGRPARGKAKNGATSEERPSKRRRIQPSDAVDAKAEMPLRATRLQSRMALQASQESRERSVVEDSEDDHSLFDEEKFNVSVGKPSVEQEDGLVPCPVCKRRMKEEAVFPHLDQCDGTDQPLPDQKEQTAKRKQSYSVAYTVPSPSKARQRLGALNYSLLSEAALRKKLAEIGIPPHGSKPLMQRRHMEWMSLWNASADSSNPMTKRELLRELDIWERTQGRQIANAQGPSGVMAKEFDAEGWTRTNKDDFADLIKRAKEKAHKSVPAATKVEEVKAEPLSQPQDFDSTPNLNQSSKRNGLVDLTSPIKPPLEQQQQSQSSQMNGVPA